MSTLETVQQIFNNGIDDLATDLIDGNFNLTIPSGSLVSNPMPTSGNPKEVIFGLVETIHRAIVSGDPTFITSTAQTNLVNSNTLRRTYEFSIDLDFNNTTLLELLDVKS